MDGQASTEQPREHTMNEIIIQMLTHINPLEESDYSIEQLEAVHAVLLTAYSIANVDKAIDGAAKPADLHGALLQQDAQTICVLDVLCTQFVKKLVLEHRIGKTRRLHARNEHGLAAQASSIKGLQLQGLSSGESRVSNRVKQIELQLEANASADQPLPGVGSRLQLKTFVSSGQSLVTSVGSPRSKVQKPFPKSNVPENTSTNPPILGIDPWQPKTSRTPSESGASPSTPTDPQIPEQSTLTPDVPENLNRNYAEQLDIELSQPDTSATPSESESPASTPSGTDFLEQHISKPEVPTNPDQINAEQPLQEAEREKETALQASTPISTPMTSQIPRFTSRKKPQASTPISTPIGFPSAKSGIPRPTEVTKLENKSLSGK
ncbi:hypothetical protein MMC29_001691 [Sticta canariensis]|nr:hypothetical protein [Sticta canariensis]